MSVRLNLLVLHGWEHKSNQTKYVKSFFLYDPANDQPIRIAAGSSNLLQGSFISPGMLVEQPRTDPEQTPTQEALSSGATNCLHLPSQKGWDSNIYIHGHLHFLIFLFSLFSTLCAAENLPNWTLCSALCHHMTDSEIQEHHKAAALLHSESVPLTPPAAP